MEKYLSLPPDGAVHGAGIDSLITWVHWLMLVLFVGWGIFYVYTLLRFRKSRNPNASYTGVKSHISSYTEVGVLVAEVVLLVGFSIPMWSNRVDDFPPEKDATVVRIVAEQFAWNIHYPGRDGKFGRTAITLIDADNPLGLDRTDPDAKDDITTLNQFNLPVNKPVLIHLSSKDVIHSINFPPYRVKQDAIPGISIPVWFTPTKTTLQIQEEMQSVFSIADAMKRTKKLALPETSQMSVSRGMNKEKYLVMQDYADKEGNPILTRGDALSEDNIARLVDGGVSEVMARPTAGLDMYVATQEYKDNAGTAIVARDETLTEDAITKLVGMGIKEVEARRVSNMDLFVAAETKNDDAGAPIVSKGDPMGEDIITKLAGAGVGTLLVAPATPTEIACAQLCGLGHYRMRGYMTVMQPEEFHQWYGEQEAALAESQPMQESAPPDTATAVQESQH